MDKSSPDQLQECYVLHRRDYSNTSLLLELFSRSQGRLPALAKGAKRPNSGKAALLQPFQPLLTACIGRGEVKTLTRAEPGPGGRIPRGKALYCGFYLNELVMRMLGRNDPHEELFDHYRAAIAGLSEEANLPRLLRRFELRLLEQTGYAMELQRDAGHNIPLHPDMRYHYDPERGPLPFLQGDAGFSVSGRTLLALATDRELDLEGSREAKELMRLVLARHLGDRPLKSRELFRTI